MEIIFQFNHLFKSEIIPLDENGDGCGEVASQSGRFLAGAIEIILAVIFFSVFVVFLFFTFNIKISNSSHMLVQNHLQNETFVIL